jgi:hypothetical protein
LLISNVFRLVLTDHLNSGLSLRNKHKAITAEAQQLFLLGDLNWEPLEGSPENVKSVCPLNANEFWAITNTNQVHFYSQSCKWQLLPNLELTHISSYKSDTWAINEQQQVFRNENGLWSIQPAPEALWIENSSAGVFLLSTSSEIFRYLPDECSWSLFKSSHESHSWKQISIGLNELWALEDNGSLWRCSLQEQSEWQSIDQQPGCSLISACGSTVWIINAEQQLACWSDTTQTFEETEEQFLFCAAPSWAVDSGSMIFKRVLSGLTVSAVTEFTKIWDDRRTGAKPYNIGFFAPVVPSGYHALGHYAERTHLGARGCVLVVKDIGADRPGATPLLSSPVDYQLVWIDKGTGGKYGDVSIWQPVPLGGYVALGYVATPGHYMKPSLDAIKCVHMGLVGPGVVRKVPMLASGALWTDKKSGAKFGDCSIWCVDPVSKQNGVTAGYFVATPNYLPPKSPLFCLQITSR